MDLFKKLQAFTCKLYTSSTRTVDINTARCSAHGVGSSSLPSVHHAKTASSCIQCRVTTRLASGDIRKSQAQSSVAGSEMTLTVEWMRRYPAPETVLQLLSCTCSRSYKLPECQCMNNGLKCTNLCKLQTCDNQPKEEDLDTMITETNLTDSETDD